jgi:hypothetical protein
MIREDIHDWDGYRCRRCGISKDELSNEQDALNKAWDMANGTGHTGW